MENMSFNIDVKIMRENVILPLLKLLETKDKKEKKAVIIEFECSEDKIFIRERDQAGVIFISFELDEGIINDYQTDIKDDELHKIALDLNKLQDALIDLNGKVSFDLDSQNKRLIITSGTYTYEIGLNVPSKIKKFPKLDAADNTVEIEGLYLYTIFKKCSGINKFVDVKLTAETEEKEFLLLFTAKESGTNTKVKVELNEFNAGTHNTNSDCVNTYDAYGTGLLEVLKESIGRIPQVKLLMKDNYPLIIHYEILENHGKVIIGIAPRINPST
uniref:Proliferating cell nuclear antigen PCNA N-terminal domain-containing protein n=1 Tax=viral metagenome TaxID=1070528 RepID=A0A6M3X5C2_9ZZZZ